MGKIYAAKTNHITNPIGFNMDSIAFSTKPLQISVTIQVKQSWTASLQE